MCICFLSTTGNGLFAQRADKAIGQRMRQHRRRRLLVPLFADSCSIWQRDTGDRLGAEQCGCQLVAGDTQHADPYQHRHIYCGGYCCQVELELSGQTCYQCSHKFISTVRKSEMNILLCGASGFVGRRSFTL